MNETKGNLTINSENIFPIIKKWLYSDHDIFVRELISNACDAITKLKALAVTKEAQIGDNEEFKVEVIYDKNTQTIEFIDNGIGMTREEVEKYINQIAFSGATEFVKNFKDKDKSDQIIGHFGLGFYSAFMVSKLVTIDTLSYKDGEDAVLWSCDGSNEFTIKNSNRKERGTTITLHLSEDGDDFKNGYKIKNTIKKYCNFMPYDIYFTDLELEAKREKEAKDANNSSQNSESNETPETQEAKDYKEDNEAPKPVNNKSPLYLKSPAQCSDEDYKAFYSEIFVDFKEPLFWIHLNMDYPFRLNGILYFPKLSTQFDTLDGQIKLYNNQVYVADNIKEVIPEFLLLLKGIIDCPDLPLNVSRSFLQNDGFVKKISEYIVKKVADKLNSIFKTQRTDYDKYWDDINPFLKFGSLKDDKFYEKIKDIIVLKTTQENSYTINEYTQKISSNANDDTSANTQSEADTKDDATKNQSVNLYYTDDTITQAQYIKLLEQNGIEVFNLSERIDAAFISLLESKNTNIKFKRVDSDLSEIEKTDEDEVQIDISQIDKDIMEVFENSFENDKVNVEIKSIASSDIPAMFVESEQTRRMNDMMKMYTMGTDSSMNVLPKEYKLVLNSKHPLIKLILKPGEGISQSADANIDKDTQKLISKQIVSMTKLLNSSINANELEDFLKSTSDIMLKNLHK